MFKFEIIPNCRIGPIELNITRLESKGIMKSLGGTLESSTESMDHYDMGFHLEFIDNILSGIIVEYSQNIQFYLFNKNVFDTPANELFNLINSNESTPITLADSEHFFTEQVIHLCDADEQYDKYQNESRVIYSTFCIGNSKYGEDISRILYGS